ncbi:glutamate-1-semialdehyde 2,1-aminomutase [Actinacidiphila alni]|uniref:Glutamate-1-semialdehyde 2,1-aminomutase n=1 Tax=Actinacidiphila alni TaxID=380248 RepID=A0A1I2AHV0_9ACTN|nr:aspartate aminotransferase family protein [Actinacidiphila alni]SFE43486.1 glutamate-1-semialdehyde 2,1-aminomutase [Actinacidiphila alni]
MSIHAQHYTRYTESATILQRALKVIPGAANSWTRWTDIPISPARAQGARLWDVDGREYLDFHGAFSAIVLGHAYPDVAQALTDQAHGLVLAGIGRTPAEVELAERLVRHIPSAEQALLAPSGSDATYSALRLARAVTRRDCIVKFAGSFHGPHDYALRSANDAGEGGTVGPDGVLSAAARTVITCEYNDLEAVADLFARRGEEIAAAIVEPIAFNASLHPEPGFLDGLRKLTTEHGALLIFDEVITGFRLGLGGAQAQFGITPDLTTLGKALGNGVPVAALVGPERHMSRFGTTPHGTVPYSGTHNGNGLAVAAANATLGVMEREPVHEHLARLGDRMRAGLREIAQDCDVPAVVTGSASIYNLLFTDTPPRTFADILSVDESLFLAYRNEMVRRGILEMPLPLMRAQVTYSHTDADVDRALETAQVALRAARDQAVNS